MKTRFIYFSMIMLALVSCAKVQEENIDSPEEVTPVSGKSLVVNTVIPETKVTISPDGDEYKMSWDGDESAKLVERSDAAANASLYTSSAIDVTAGKAAFTFDGLTPVAGTTVYNYDILYPASAVGAATGDVIAMTMPATQTPKTASADPAAALLAGRNASDFADQPASVNANFNHLAAYGKMTLKNLSKGSFETVTSISITIEAEECNIAGDLEYDAETGVADYNSSSESVITINGTNLTWVYGGFDVWFACKPFTLPSGKKLIVTTTLNGTLVQTATMVAKADVDFNAGEVTEFPAFGTTYTVTFNTQGGSTIAPAYVGRGNKVKEPTAPTKALAGGLYEAVIVDPSDGYTFGGWYENAEGTGEPYDFNTTLYSNKTLYAKWIDKAAKVDLSAIDASSFNASDPAKLLYQSITYINSLAGSAEPNYTAVLNNNATVWEGSFPTLNNASSELRIAAVGGVNRYVQTSNSTNLISASAGTLIIGSNITVKCTGLNASVSAISVSGTSVVKLEDGGSVAESSFKAALISVNSSNASFIMEDGSSISGNTGSVDTSAESVIRIAPIVVTWGSFIMNGGVISGNSVTTSSLTKNMAGAVYINDWANGTDRTFLKTGGEIKENTATRTGSGEITGRRGNQVLIRSANRKIDSAIGSSQNLDGNSCWSSPWVTANVE